MIEQAYLEAPRMHPWKARWKRFQYLLLFGIKRGECAINIKDSKGKLMLLASGVPTDGPMNFTHYKVWWEKPGLPGQSQFFRDLFQAQKVRWIHSSIRAGKGSRVQIGVVIKKYKKAVVISDIPGMTEDFYTIKMDDGQIVDYACDDFTRAPDGVLEYRF